MAVPILLFFGGTYLKVFKSIGMDPTFHYTLSGFGFTKLLPFYLFYLGAMFAYLHERPLLAIVLLLFLTLAYSIILPSATLVSIGIVLYLGLRYHTLGKFGKRLLSLLLVYLLSITIFLLYVRTPNLFKRVDLLSTTYTLQHFDFSNDLKFFFTITVGGALHIGLLYLLPLLVLIVYKPLWIGNYKVKTIVVFMLLMTLSSLAVWAFFYKDLNSVQFFLNVIPPLYNVVFFYLLAYTCSRASRWSQISIGIIMGAICFFNIAMVLFRTSFPKTPAEEAMFQASVIEMLDSAQVKNSVGVVLLGAEDCKESLCQTDLMGSFISIHHDRYQLVSLSDYMMNLKGQNKLDSLRRLSLLEENFFHRYLEWKKKTKHYPYPLLSNEHWKHQLQFIDENKIEYAFVSKHYPYADSLLSRSTSSLQNKKGDYFLLF